MTAPLVASITLRAPGSFRGCAQDAAGPPEASQATGGRKDEKEGAPSLSSTSRFALGSLPHVRKQAAAFYLPSCDLPSPTHTQPGGTSPASAVPTARVRLQAFSRPPPCGRTQHGADVRRARLQQAVPDTTGRIFPVVLQFSSPDRTIRRARSEWRP